MTKKSVTTMKDDYIIKTVKRHELRLKNANKIYVGKSDKELMRYLKEKGLM